MVSKAKIRYYKGRLSHWKWQVEQQELFIKHLWDKNVSWDQMIESEATLYKNIAIRDDFQRRLTEAQIAFEMAEMKAKEIPIRNGEFSEI